MTAGSAAMPHVTIIGGGLIGLTSAVFLSDQGVKVTILDSAELGSGASQGNAGYICSTIVGPLAGPGAMTNAMKSLGKPDSALRVHPAQLPRLIPWFLSFVRASTAAKYTAAQLALGRLNSRTPQLVDRLRASGARIDMGKPLLVPFHDVKLATHFLESLRPMRDLGCDVPESLLSGNDMRQLVPALTAHITCGLELPGERSIDPPDFVRSLVEILASRDVTLKEHCHVTDVKMVNGRVTMLHTSDGPLDVDQVVLAAGAGIRKLGRLFGLRIPVIAGQGYNVMLPSTDQLTHPVICEEAHAVATPLPNGIRLGGTMEFAGDSPRFDQRRVDAILRSMRTYLDLDWDRHGHVWAGSRPMSPDGLPLIGRPTGLNNVVIAGGHGMYGLTLAPTTAAAVSQLIVDGRSDIDLSAFAPNRFRL